MLVRREHALAHHSLKTGCSRRCICPARTLPCPCCPLVVWPVRRGAAAQAPTRSISGVAGDAPLDVFSPNLL